MAITQVIKTPPLQQAPKLGAHVHTCSRYQHQFDCQYSMHCHVESRPAAQKIIDDMCPACFNLRNDNFAT